MISNTLLRRLAGGLVVGIVAAAIMRAAIPIAGANSPVAQTTPPPAAVTVVSRRDLVRTETLTAELRPYQEVKVYAKVAGYLKSIGVDYGDRVSRGAVLATLEVPEQQDDLARAEARYGIAKLNYDRLLAVAKAEPGLLAQEQIDRAQADYQSAKAEHDRENALAAYDRITAPFDGVITERYADPGALIQAGTSSQAQTMPIVQLSDNYRLRLGVEVPESLVPDIAVGTPVRVRLQATGEAIASRVARLSCRVADDTRTMHIEVDLDNADLRIKPGMYAWVDIEVASRKGVVAVPLQSLSGGAAPAVWVVTPGNTLVQRPVKVGIETADWAEITEGLAPGEKVLFGSNAVFSPGMTVTPKPVNPVLASE